MKQLTDNPSFSQDEAAEDEDDIAQALSDDYTRAEFIRDRLVPKAVLFFTGEALEEDGDDEDVSSCVCHVGYGCAILGARLCSCYVSVHMPVCNVLYSRIATYFLNHLSA